MTGTTVGICGNLSPSVAEQQDVCVLPHGHDGWHQDDSTPPAHWTWNLEPMPVADPHWLRLVVIPNPEPKGTQ
jgi:hypothetical protein